MIRDFRKGHNRFVGIVLQEHNPTQRSIVRPMAKILGKSVLSDGPNLYKQNSWYNYTGAFIGLCVT